MKRPMALLSISILAGFGEEILFRGVIQHALTGVTGWAMALVVTSLLFGVAHIVTVSYFWYASVFGAAAGGLLLITGNLLAPIVTHVIYDFLALVYLVRRSKHRRTTYHDPNGHNDIPKSTTHP